MATVITPPAARIVSAAMSSWLLRWRRTSANTGSIDVATRTTARTLWSVAVAALALLLVLDGLVET